MNGSDLKPEIRKTLKALSGDHGMEALSAHVMSQFIFCERAGIIAYESNQEDSGSEFEPAPALGGLPLYDVDLIKQRLERLEMQLRNDAVYVFGFTLFCLVVMRFHFEAGLVLLASFASLGLWWYGSAILDDVDAYWKLKRRLRTAEAAKVQEPNWDLKVQQEVNWWELLAAGWESSEPRQALRNHQIGVVGKPWRILHRGIQRMPVLRIRVDDDSGQMLQFHPHEQQRARMAAYSFLIETCERGDAEWAIVLLGDGDRGIAYPIGRADWQALHDGLPRAREAFGRYKIEDWRRPRLPDDNRCRKCPFGRPLLVGARESNLKERPAPQHLTSDRHNRLYYSTCHERFGGKVPPHERAIELELMD